MRYTRYDLKNKNNGNMIYAISLVAIIAIALIVGSLISKLVFAGNKASNGYSNVEANTTDGNKKYIFLQCGIFSKKENADTLLNELDKMGNPSEINDGDKIRVIFGVYKEDDYYKKAIKLLNDNKFDVHEIYYNIHENNMTNTEIEKILDGNIEIINKFTDKNVKGIQTSDFKTWSDKLENTNKEDINFGVLEEFKNYISKMTNNYSKDNITDNTEFLYKEFEKIKQN